ncbi:hypothetical protein [Caballeronia sp. LZ032]|uniref:hypothetical protein n=1 Tax=Caballeronia sp. LZ032 TaxID=3038565 RepID=UPI0028570517|nr:hypothetical protein [Caballeronia sp. LZ032]MDR5883789.1 hypothetical protein [Caballeronia sp. LZ032]
MALAFAPATVSLNIHEDLPVENGLMSRSYPRNRIMQSPTFCALTSVVRPTTLGPDVSLEELQQRNTFMLYG